MLPISYFSFLLKNSCLFFCLFARWTFYREVISFASLPQSFASMTDVIMLSNWPLFMDAAADVGNGVTARIFFYSFKVRCFDLL